MSEARPTAAALIDALLEHAQGVEEGSFTLDAVAAASKLDAFAYGDRSQYLIPMIEAGHGLDASKVTLSTAGVDLRIEFEGVELQAPERTLHDLYAHALGTPAERRARALGRLGVGLHMALGYGSIERIAVTHASAQQAITAIYRRGQAPELRRRPASAGRSAVLEIFVDRPWAGMMEFGGSTRHELRRVQAAVRHSPRIVELDGLRISGQARAWDEELCVQGEAGGYRFAGAFELEGSEPSTVELWTEDVCIDTVTVSDYCFRASVTLDAPRRDLSQMQVVRDASVAAALEGVARAQAQLQEQLGEAQSRWEARGGRPEHWPVERVARARGVERPPDSSALAKEGPGLTQGLVFAAVGLLAGVFGVGMLARGNYFGLIPLIFLLGHGYVGVMVTVDVLDGQSSGKGAKTIALFALLVGLAVLLGVRAANLFP